MSDLNLWLLAAQITATAAPILLAALGETLTEKAGLINLSLDGSILLAAMAGFAAACGSGSLLLGFGVGAAVGAGVALVVALASIRLDLSQVAVGFVLTLMARDLAYFLGNPYTRIPGPQLGPLWLPGLQRIPGLGVVLFQQNALVYGSLAGLAALWIFLYRTRWGLELQAVGENPQAAYARGIDARRVQLLATLAGGALVGLAGAGFSLCVKPGWGRPQGAEGIGWIALALVIFGGWHPLKVALGAYLFATLQVAGIPLQSHWPRVPAQIFQVAPFPLMIFTLLLMEIAQKERVERWVQRHPGWQRLLGLLRGRAPRSLGQPYRRD